MADYQSAIAQIEYNNTSSNPDTTPRSVTVVVNDGETDSNTATTTINITPSNDPPTLDLDGNDSSGASGNDYTTTFSEGGSAVAIGDADVTITDADDTNIESATITLTNRPDGDSIESLSVNGTLPGGITASAYNSATGEITLTGTATLADYQSAIAQIEYNNTSSNPDTTARSVTVVVNDGETDSNTATTTINITPSNDPPVADDESFTMEEDGGAIALDLLTGDTDPDGDTLSVKSINGTDITPGIPQTIGVDNGTVSVAVDGSVSFTPTPGYNGPISFDYVVEDGNGWRRYGDGNGNGKPNQRPASGR